jgi:hypothetical protein
MKTIALTLFAAALGLAQSQSSGSSGTTSAGTTSATAPATTKAAPKAASKTQNKKPAELTPQQKAAAQLPTIPAGAKLIGPNLYRYTDSSGKTWNYRQTPFGLSRWEENSASAPQAAQPAPQDAHQDTLAKSEPVVVTDLGDSYRFEKKTPFGVSTWVSKKTELTDKEKALTSVQQTPPGSNQTSVSGKPAENQ